jgi:hypothetical protein
MQKIKYLLVFILLHSGIIHSQPLFTEVSDEVGLNFSYPGNQFQMAGSGLMVIDINNDGWEDLFQCGGVFDSKLWLNKEGEFKDVTQQYNLGELSGYFIQGAVAADFNNDGFEDFIITNFGKGLSSGDEKHPVVLINVGGDHFDYLSLEGALELGYYTSASVGDINNDGFVDIYITNYLNSMGEIEDSLSGEMGYNPSCSENKLLINENGTSFIEASELYGINDNGCGLSSSLVDIDNDNDLDILLLNDFGMWSGIGNKCFQNNYPEASFSDISDQINFNKKMYGMGIGSGDYNSDGEMEFYVTSVGQNSLYKIEAGSFKDIAKHNEVDLAFVYDSIRGTSWSGLFFDYEFDGDLDLFISKGNVAILTPKTAITDPNKLFIQERNTFVDTSEVSGINNGLSHRGAVILDYDRDGDLDIITSVAKMPWGAFGGQDQKIKCYRNNVIRHNFIVVELVGEEGINKNAFGSKVYFNKGSKTMVKTVDNGSGHASQSTRLLYFGLGNNKSLDELQIIWPNGVHTFHYGLPANQKYTIHSDGEIIKQKYIK